MLHWRNVVVKRAKIPGDVTYVVGFGSNRGERVQGLGSAAWMVGVHHH